VVEKPYASRLRRPLLTPKRLGAGPKIRTKDPPLSPEAGPKVADIGRSPNQEAEQSATKGRLPAPLKRSPHKARRQRLEGVVYAMEGRADVQDCTTDEEADHLGVEPVQAHEPAKPPLQTRGVGKGWAWAEETGLYNEGHGRGLAR